MFNINTKQILEKEITRQQFLKTVGIMVLALFGLPQLLAILHRSTGVNQSIKRSSKGYGSSAYGV